MRYAPLNFKTDAKVLETDNALLSLFEKGEPFVREVLKDDYGNQAVRFAIRTIERFVETCKEEGIIIEQESF